MLSASELRDTVRAEFHRLGMHSHVGMLRGWPDDFVLEWARMLRLPPHDGHYQIRARDFVCCGRHGLYIGIVWPKGHLAGCRACGARWIVLA